MGELPVYEGHGGDNNDSQNFCFLGFVMKSDELTDLGGVCGALYRTELVVSKVAKRWRRQINS